MASETVTAKKQHYCSLGCGKPIKRGQKMVKTERKKPGTFTYQHANPQECVQAPPSGPKGPRRSKQVG